MPGTTQEKRLRWLLAAALAVGIAACAGGGRDLEATSTAAADAAAEAPGPPAEVDSPPAGAGEPPVEPAPPAEKLAEAAIESQPEPALETEPQPPPPAPDPAELAASALEALDSAGVFWSEGDLENAMHSLDRAYELMLQLPDDDPDWEQQKEDLRHVVSRRIVEIYRSRLTTASDPGSPIPVEINAHVQRELKSFQGPERQFFVDSYRRSGLHRPMIARKLREAGLPEELSWLPLVESGFKTRALSRARALGLWQFISSTGYRYGLSRSYWIDERMDPEKATDGAIGYLSELHGLFGDWMLALAGYNCGEHRVLSVIKSQNNGYLDHFWDLFERLPWETARYVPRFLATLLIVRDPEKYGFELPEPLPAVDARKIAVQRHVRLEDLDRELGLAAGTLVALNPELRRGITPAERYELNVPADSADGLADVLAAMPAYVPPREEYVVHRVRRGETLSAIAARYRSSVSTIVRANNLRSRNRIWPGQRLKIPVRGSSVRTASIAVANGAPATSVHTVRRGDNLWKLASRYGTTVDRIKRDNGLTGDELDIGQKLTINTGLPPGSKTYLVRRGDTISKIADAHRISMNALLRANGLSKYSTIYPGQVLLIPD